MKKVIRLTESDLHKIIKESVKKCLNEIGDTNRGLAAIGAVKGRNYGRYCNGLTQTNDGTRKSYMHVKNMCDNAIENNGGYSNGNYDAISNGDNYGLHHGKGSAWNKDLNENLNEIGDTNRGQYMLGRLAGRNQLRGNQNIPYHEIKDYADEQSGSEFGVPPLAFGQGRIDQYVASRYGDDYELPNGRTISDDMNHTFNGWKSYDDKGWGIK